ncbi:MAG: DMT family transporter [Treponema sp.]|uniref:DMT family transporter n=1 Tax=Treponema sp. TaxID=166 RepID=UPI001D9CEA0C|nr:DMT family transporter [Treponema sp.]MBS7310681.1 DMT family transporter [Treponema sp.]
MNKKLIGILASGGLILTAAIWGFAFVVVKDSVDTIPPVYMVSIRYTIAAVLLGFVLIPQFKKLNRYYWIHGAVTGLMLALGYITQTIGCKYTTAGKNAFLTTIYVILIPLISWPLNKKRPHFVVFLSAVMALVGIGLLALRNEGGVLGFNVGDILTLICGLFYALHIIFTAKFSQDKNPVILTWIQFIVAAVFSWAVSPLIDGSFSVALLKSSRVIFSMLYLGIFSSLVAFLLQNICLKYMESSLASLFLSLESVFGVIFSTIFLRERMTLVMIIGCVLIFAAITIADQFHENKQ